MRRLIDCDPNHMELFRTPFLPSGKLSSEFLSFRTHAILCVGVYPDGVAFVFGLNWNCE